MDTFDREAYDRRSNLEHYLRDCETSELAGFENAVIDAAIQVRGEQPSGTVACARLHGATDQLLGYLGQREIEDKRAAEENGCAGLCSDCPPVGYPTDGTRCDSCPRRKLDASLIAAAPDLLIALEKALVILRREDDRGHLETVGKSVIALAESAITNAKAT